MMTAPITENGLEQSILHVGCGGSPLPDWLKGKEIRVDIDGQYSPDILANMISLGEIGQYNVVYTSHSLEHLTLDEIKMALNEFKRVLLPKGVLLVFVPDLQGISATNEVLFESEAGPISGLDLIYGHQKQVKESPYMQHKYGFTKNTLETLMIETGFNEVQVKRLPCYNLMGVGVK